MLAELHQGVLADLLTEELGWGWDERSRRHSDRVRWEVTGVPKTYQWRVAGSHADGSLTLQRRKGSGKVHVPVDYVREHVELAYASTAHRAQGRTVDTAHAIVGPTTTREVLYVSATRARRPTASMSTPTTTPTPRPPTTMRWIQ